MTEVLLPCNGCHENLPLDAFGKSSNSRGRGKEYGRQYKCKKCAKSYDEDRKRKLRAREEITYAPDYAKTCPSCKKSLPVDAFGRHSDTLDQLSRICLKCKTLKNRDSHLMRQFNLPADEYERMLDEQDHKCYLCRRECKTANRLSVDHCHKTGKVRRLLCRLCNAGLGAFQDDYDLLMRAAEYVRGE